MSYLEMARAWQAAQVPEELNPETEDKPIDQNRAVMFQKAVDAIAKHYAAGTLDFIELYYPDKFAELCRLQSELDRVWAEHDEAQFREALKAWYVAHIAACKLFKKHEGWLADANKKLAMQGWCLLKDTLSKEYFLIVDNEATPIPNKYRNYCKYTVNEVNTFPECDHDAFMRSHKVKKAFKAKYVEDSKGWPWQEDEKS